MTHRLVVIHSQF